MELDRHLQERRVLLAYLITEDLNEYAQVAATAQAYINDPETILGLVANDQLEEALEDLRGMESVLIDVDPDKEEMVPRPDPSESVLAEAEAVVAESREEGGVLAEHEDSEPDSLAAALAPEHAAETDVVADTRGLDADDLEGAIERVTDSDLDDLRTAPDSAATFGDFEPAAGENDPDDEADSASEAADGGQPAADSDTDGDSHSVDETSDGAGSPTEVGDGDRPSEVAHGEQSEADEDDEDSDQRVDPRDLVDDRAEATDERGEGEGDGDALGPDGAEADGE
jgi:flagellar protein FlaI